MKQPPVVTFVSLHPPTMRALADAFRDLLSSSVVTCTVADVRDLPISPGTMFVSPANCLNVALDAGVHDHVRRVDAAVHDDFFIC